MPPEISTAQRRKASRLVSYSNSLATSKRNGLKPCSTVLRADITDPMEALPRVESFSTRPEISMEQLLTEGPRIAARHTSSLQPQAGHGRKPFFTTSHAIHPMEPIQREVLSLTPRAICMA